jgi:hypothetical protein
MRFGGREAKAESVDLPADEPALIKLFIQYLYQADYNPLVFPGDDDLYESLAKQGRPRYLGAREIRYDDGEIIHYAYDFPHTCVATKEHACPERNLCPHHTCYNGLCRYDCHYFICTMCKVDPDDGPEQLLVHAKVWQLGDKYFIDGLEDLAEVKFEIAAQRYWNSPEFMAAVEFVVGNDLRGPRTALLRVLSRHHELWEKKGIKAVLKGDGEFAYDVIMWAESWEEVKHRVWASAERRK